MSEEIVIYTLGHSNRELNELINLLKKYNIKLLIDVRRFPTSKRYPHFNRENLGKVLNKYGIAYVWLGSKLGGFRSGGYKAYMNTEEFREGLRNLLSLINNLKEGHAAIMCRERLWFKCHRRFIADELVKLGYKVIHIIDDKRVYTHRVKS